MKVLSLLRDCMREALHRALRLLTMADRDDPPANANEDNPDMAVDPEIQDPAAQHDPPALNTMLAGDGNGEAPMDVENNTPAAAATNPLKEAENPDPQAAMQVMMQFLAALTPAMAGMGGPMFMPALNSLMGPAPQFSGDGKITWSNWIKQMVNRLTALQIPKDNWVAIVLALLIGPALSYAVTNGIDESTAWDTFLAIMAAGPWASKDTTFSLLFRLTRGSLGNGNPVDTVTQVEQLRAKISFLMPAQFWIFVLLLNLLPSFRESLLVAPNGKEWESYEELRTVVLSKAAAQRSANGSRDTGKPTKPNNHNNNNGNKWHNGPPKGNRSSGAGSGPGTSRGNDGAGPSDPNAGRKRKADVPICFGCGATDHKISDRRPDGTPVCPNYDEQRLRKGKYPMHPKFRGNGKGK